MPPTDSFIIAYTMPASQAAEHEPKQVRVKRLPDKLRPTMWKPGQSGNARGRVKGSGLTDILIKMLPQQSEDKGLTWAEYIVKHTLRHVKKGNSFAIKEIWERIEGKVRQEVDIQIESSLWARLDEGRKRIAAINPEPELGITFDQPALEAEVVKASVDAVTEAMGSEPDQVLAELDSTPPD